MAFASASDLVAQAVGITSGTYTTSDGRYSITVQSTEAGLTLVEPNLTSFYASVGGGIYEYTHTNGTRYAIRAVGPGQMESFKPGVNGPGTNRAGTSLRLSAAAPATTAQNADFMELFEEYQKKMASDPADTHLWAACGAAALARASFNDAGYEEYVRKVIASIKPVMENPANNPCEDVIPSSVWRSVR